MKQTNVIRHRSGSVIAAALGIICYGVAMIQPSRAARKAQTMKLSLLLTTTLFATASTARAVPTVYLTLGDDIPQYHAGSGKFLGNLGTFPGVNISGDSSE